jgi:hypothetical protein
MGGRIVFLFVLVFSFCQIVFGQEERSLIRKGNAFMEDSLFLLADSIYMEALNINPNSIEAKYNRANALYYSGKYEEAIALLKSLPQNELVTKDQVLHDIGNAHLKNQQLEEAIASFKSSLKVNPNRADTRYNLAYALQQKSQQNKKENNKENDKNQDQKDQENKDQQNQDKKNDQEQDQKQDQQDSEDSKKNKEGEENKNSKQSDQNKEQENKDGGKGDGKNEDDPQKNPDQSPSNMNDDQETGKEQKQGAQGGQAGKEGQMSEKEAEQILKSLDDNEKQLQKRLIQRQLKEKQQNGNDKDW